MLCCEWTHKYQIIWLPQIEISLATLLKGVQYIGSLQWQMIEKKATHTPTHTQHTSIVVAFEFSLI